MHYIGKKEANYLGLKEHDRINHNENYLKKAQIKYKDYFDHLFDEINPEIVLDSEQRQAILIDEDKEMVIAGAGSGKTTTMVGKVKFLVECLHVQPKDILVISYTNKAVEELKEQLCDKFLIPVRIGTFHHIALQMLKEATGKSYQIENDGITIVYDFLKERVEKEESLRKQFNELFTDYFHLSSKFTRLLQGVKEYVYSGGKNSVSSEEIDKWYSFSEKYQCTLAFNKRNEQIDQVHFCTILYRGIYFYVDYFEYPEKFSTKIKYSCDRYIKLRKHKKYHTHYITLFQGEDIENVFLKYCSEHNIFVEKVSSLAIFTSFIHQKKYYKKFVEMLYDFILLWKKNGKKGVVLKNCSKEEKIFFSFALEAFQYYQSVLEERGALDFEDIIGMCYQKLSKKNQFPDYIIVDEYQDISKDRLLLLKKICKLGYVKLIVVGDDWQSIYNFSGSKLSLFTSFQREFPFSKVVHITQTYRNSQELIDISGKFIMKNKEQIVKKLKSKKSLKKPILYINYRDNDEKCKKLKKILHLIYKNNPKDSVLLLSRFRFDFSFLDKDKEFYHQGEVLKYHRCSNLSITCLTTHTSKGLGFDQVIIVNNEKGIYGFPSNKGTNPYLNLLYQVSDEENLMEERRLFYVALTRTKNKVYLMVKKNNASIFIEELKKEKAIFPFRNH